MYQKIKNFNKKVKEIAPVNEESATWITAIIKGLKLAEEYNEFHEGFMYWINELNNYLLVFELHFSKVTHLELIHLMYRHTTNLDHDTLIQQGCMDALYKLLKCTKSLKPSDLQLDWRPFYNLARHYKSFYSTIIRHGNDFIRLNWGQFHRCVTRASPYFAPNATREILNELSPRLCSTSVDFETQAQYLALLPIRFLPEVSPEDAIQLWAKPLLKFWSESAVGTKAEPTVVQNLANLADCWHDQIDLEPHLSNLCSLIHRCLRLPVGKSPNSVLPPKVLPASQSGHSGGSERGKGAEERFLGKVAGLLIGTIRPESDVAVNEIKRLLRLLEPYMHPSNNGRWLASIICLIRKLLTKLIHRLTDERHGHSHKAWWRYPPKETHISESQRLALFDMLLEPAFVLVHARGYTINVASSANLICQLNPTVFLRRLFSELQPAMLDSSQPHRLCALLLTASRSSLAIVRYAPEEVAPLLYSVLPFLELSNPLRLASALSLIQELVHEISLDVQLEEFSSLFMDRVLAMIDSMLNGSPGFSGASSKASVGLTPLLEIFYNMLMRGSDEVQAILGDKLKNWSIGAAYEPDGAAKNVLRLFAAFSGSLPGAIVSWSIQQAVSTVEAEGGPDVALEERVSSKLLWDVAVMESTISNADTLIDSGMLACRDQLAYVLHCCLRAKDKRLSRLSARLFVQLTTGGMLAEVYPTLDCNAYRKIGWGERFRLKDIKIDWHETTEDEKLFIRWMANEFLWPETQLLASHIDGKNLLEKQELLRCVTCLAAFAQSAWLVMSPPPKPGDSQSADPSSPANQAPPNYPASMSIRQGPNLPSHLLIGRGNRLRLEIGEQNSNDNRADVRQLLLNLFVRLIKTIESTDLSEVIQQAIAGITALMLPGPRVSIASTLEILRIRDNAEPDWILELGRGQDTITRLLRRLTGFTQLRSQLAWSLANSRLPDIVDVLMRLVGSPYRMVSSDASNALVRLCTELGPISSGFRLLAPGLEQLASSDCEHQVMGALTLMIGGSAAGYVAPNHLFSVPDWFARSLLCRCLATVQLSDHSNKTEVEALLGSCVVQMSRSFQSLGCHDPVITEQLVSELTQLQERSSGWKCTHLTVDSMQFTLHPRHHPGRLWLQFYLRMTQDVNVRCRERAFACLAAFVWLKKRRVDRILLPAPTADSKGPAVVHADWFRDGSDHLFGLPNGAVFRVRNPNAKPDYAEPNAAIDEHLQLVLDFLASPATWSSLLGYCRSRGGLNDHFLANFAHFVTCISRVAGPKGAANFYSPLADLLSESAEAETYQACHSMGSTIWFALIAGTKHWLPADRDQLFNTCLLPALFNCQASSDTWDIWRSSYVHRFLRNSLDGSLLWPLADAIESRLADFNAQADNSASDSAGSTSSSRYCLLFTVRRLLLQYGKWRYPNRMRALLNDLLSSRQLSDLFADSESVRSTRRAGLSHCLDCLGDSAADAFLAALADAPVDSAAFKTLVWALASHVSVLRRPLAKLICGSIAPLCRAVQSIKTDDDKVRSCLQHLPGALVLSRDSDIVAEALSSAVSDPTSWQGRRAALCLLQGLAYHSAFQLNARRLLSLIMDRLSDATVEVRECAGQALSGLMACGLCDWTNELLHRMGRLTMSKDPIARHAGVLGLSAAVSAHPYTVPEHLPELVARLCQLAMSASGQAGAAARKAVNDFKRTHQDGWERDRDKFTPDQLSLLSDAVVSQSYYA